MTNDQLIIAEQQADLSSDSRIALTIQVNDLANLADRQSTYSNSIKLPNTANNVAIWGYPAIDAFTQGQPYKKLPCKLIRNGVEMISNGLCSIISVSNQYIEVQVTYGITGFADALKIKVYVDFVLSEIRDAKLNDLDWSDIPNFEFKQTTIAASQNSGPVLWPVIDYGYSLTNSSTINSTYLRPGIYHKQVLDRIQSYTGYTFLGGANYTAGFDDFTPFSANILYDYQGTNYYDTALPLSVAKNLPDFTVKDFLIDYMNRYFLTPVVDNVRKTITFKSFDELYQAIPSAKDWSGKFVNENYSVNFSIGDYAQTNNLLWTADNSLFTGNGIINIANETLDTNQNLLTSIFAASDNLPYLSQQQVASIKKFNSTPLPGYGKRYEIETKPRVLKIVPLQGNWTFDNGSATQVVNGIKTAKFVNWNTQLNLYAKGLLKLLKKARKTDRVAVLNEIDLKDFNHFIPVYDEKEAKYYYVNKVNNFISGKKTTVSLIRM